MRGEGNLPALETKKGFDASSLTIILLTCGLFLLLAATSETFFSFGNLQNSFNNLQSILYGVSIDFFAAIGFTFLIIMGELDLSVGSVAAFSGMFTGYLMRVKVPLVPAMAASLAVCVIIGLANGFLVVRFKVPSMMITLGSMTAVRGLADVLCSNLYGYTYPRTYQRISKLRVGSGVYALFAVIAGVVIAAVILEILLKRASVFKKMYYVGENIETARVYGIKSGQLKMVIFAISAFTAGIGGIYMGARLGFAETAIGSGLEFKVLTAAVLGGASLSGGKGSVVRTGFGLIFLALILSGVIINNINPLYQQLIIGIMLVAAVFIDTRVGLSSERGAGLGTRGTRSDGIGGAK
ncbi:MAG: ABC transporter permease [Synergistaceae bacterium]|jgi:ribose transport system permease protein|nr:ABC transporter permease [Synergistaceae bacterium]